ncbi:receptor-type tyrosine-protein phosphatase H isoform X1 [Oncorhynchus nerka]|uniref:receptor-type tyrosine-protein phosphatase H isoform X1 n=2 Tax=Oncorhynchus nerka TaxID=8023 RepID=UPI001131FEFD|nr:receptor-type tyrosine-protein phosphatase H isoform X1 [Oncorhynchus nerka]
MVWSSSLAMGLSHVIMCLCVAGVWCQSTTPSIPSSTIKPTLTAVTHVTVMGQDETSITLAWTKIPEYTYELKFQNGTSLINTTGKNQDLETQTVSSLTAGTAYNFTLFSVRGSDRSEGLNFTADTAPINVAQVNVTGQEETNVTLQWNKVNGNGITYELQFSDRTNTTIPVSDVDGSVTYTVSPLNAGTNYEFVLFTVFKGVPSKGYNFSAITRPLGVGDVNVTGQNETSITLQWSKVNGTGITYELLDTSGRNTIIPASNESGTVTHIVSPLTVGAKYTFTLFSVFEGVRSTVGSKLSAVTAPLNVEAVTVRETHRNETSVTLEWKRPAEGVSSYVLHFDDMENKDIPNAGETVTHQFSTLKSGKRYAFTLFTVFEGIKSSGKSDFTVTKICCSALSWEVTSSSIQTVHLSEIVSNGEANNGSQPQVVSNINGNLSFTLLYPGAEYTLTLWFEKDSKKLPLCEQVETVVPPALIRPRCDYLSSGYAFSLAWDVPEGIWTSVEVNVTGKSPQRVEGERVRKVDINGVQPAQTYRVSLASISGRRISQAVSFSCNTDPRGVIAGSVMAVLLLCLLVCLVFFIWRQKPEIFSRPKLLFVESKLTSNKFKAIPTGKFSDHYHTMSADTNRGFSEEYEDFVPVGTEQTQKAAILEENKNKNRFTNVLPYDWCRVKLTILNQNMSSDYINANYMPGYGNSRQYIAAQGPLPTTVDDFWRMIWEQRVKGVVMVTNCTEGGRAKCEQYWPLDYTPCLYGDLLVTVRSEKRETNWTLREFVVKSRDTSEERPVKHFHFTAWPDHGVPEGTEALIQFRGLVRQHIESQENSGPTVVHCSAGVGRTGTIIALDVMLQQLEREKAVGIAAFVHKMRLSRPLMVQTESQYVFLHQCIMDSLEPKEKMIQEALYENSDLIYANATALREFQAANPKA